MGEMWVQILPPALTIGPLAGEWSRSLGFIIYKIHIMTTCNNDPRESEDPKEIVCVYAYATLYMHIWKYTHVYTYVRALYIVVELFSVVSYSP